MKQLAWRLDMASGRRIACTARIKALFVAEGTDSDLTCWLPQQRWVSAERGHLSSPQSLDGCGALI